MDKLDPRISIITLGVNDLAKATKFYQQGLGLPLSTHSSDHISFFDLSSSWLALFPKQALADDVGIDSQGSGFSGVTLAHNVDSKQKVDQALNLAQNAGATIVKPAQDVFWGGYSGYFKDLDGYLWEVAWNPLFSVDVNTK